MNILITFGTRPEAHKMIPLILELRKVNIFSTKVCVTAQHRELLDIALKPFNIIPDYDLNIMQPGQTLSAITSKILTGIDPILEAAKPDLLLAHGDTSTTFAASLAAFYRQIKVGHVEAGLRTSNKFEPFPEEINRRLTSHIADLHFAPTELSKNNLLSEGVPAENIYVTGNTGVDFTRLTVRKNYIFNEERLNSIPYSKRIILITAHRRENWGEPLDNIAKAVTTLANKYKDDIFIWPAHPSQPVQSSVKNYIDQNRVLITAPLDPIDLHNLMSHCYLTLTDSGGIQEEAPAFNLPTLVLRNVTERPEGLTAGTLKLIGTDYDNIISQTEKLLDDKNIHYKMANAKNPFGDGFASKKITDILLNLKSG